MRNHISKIIIICLIMLVLPLKTEAYNDSTHFPPVLTNDARKKTPNADLPLKKSRIIFGAGQKKLSGLLICPADAGTMKAGRMVSYPGILFLQTNDETPDQWKQRISELAGKGYSVMSVNYKNGADVEEAFLNIMKLDVVDKTSVGVLGVHQGYPEAIIIAIKKAKDIKCVVCISGNPPYNIPGGEPAESINCPVMLVHGNIDEQTPVSVSQFFYDSLKGLGKEARIFFMPNTRHYYNDADWARAQTEFIKFMNLYLKGIPDPDADKPLKPENAP